jgi:hypothetical protein
MTLSIALHSNPYRQATLLHLPASSSATSAPTTVGLSQGRLIQYINPKIVHHPGAADF